MLIERKLLDFIQRKRSPLPPTTDTAMRHLFMATEMGMANTSTSTKGPKTALKGTAQELLIGVLPQPQHQMEDPTDPPNIVPVVASTPSTTPTYTDTLE